MKPLKFIIVLISISLSSCVAREEPSRPYSAYLINNQTEDAIKVRIAYSEVFEQVKLQISNAGNDIAQHMFYYDTIIVEPKKETVFLTYVHNAGYCIGNESSLDKSVISLLPNSLCPTILIDSLFVLNTTDGKLLKIDNNTCSYWTHEISETCNDYWYPGQLYVTYVLTYPIIK